jgi:hypothetical protein
MLVLMGLMANVALPIEMIDNNKRSMELSEQSSE